MSNSRKLLFLLLASGIAAAVSATDSAAPNNRPALPTVGPGAQVIEGPGFRIEKLKPKAGRRVASDKPSRSIGGPVSQTVFCRAGDNLLLAGVRLETAGSGVVAQSGCRLRIIDSQINTGGVALIVEAGANVDLRNSVLTSRVGSVEAAPKSRLAAHGASFAGPATLTGVDFLDRGGNLWGSAP